MRFPQPISRSDSLRDKSDCGRSRLSQAPARCAQRKVNVDTNQSDRFCIYQPQLSLSYQPVRLQIAQHAELSFKLPFCQAVLNSVPHSLTVFVVDPLQPVLVWLLVKTHNIPAQA
jgi:hypothetical protein